MRFGLLVAHSRRPKEPFLAASDKLERGNGGHARDQPRERDRHLFVKTEAVARLGGAATPPHGAQQARSWALQAPEGWLQVTALRFGLLVAHSRRPKEPFFWTSWPTRCPLPKRSPKRRP